MFKASLMSPSLVPDSSFQVWMQTSRRSHPILPTLLQQQNFPTHTFHFQIPPRTILPPAPKVPSGPFQNICISAPIFYNSPHQFFSRAQTNSNCISLNDLLNYLYLPKYLRIFSFQTPSLLIYYAS